MGHYATGICFVDQATHLESEALFEEIAKDCSLKVKISSPKAATLQVIGFFKFKSHRRDLSYSPVRDVFHRSIAVFFYAANLNLSKPRDVREWKMNVLSFLLFVVFRMECKQTMKGFR
jgi:hypothetical protein